MKASDLKRIVKEKYGEIARQSGPRAQSSCCGSSSCCGNLEFSMIGEEYQAIEGYHPEADLGLGCGLPTQFAGIKPGHFVLDLGSGAGNDCFVARSLVGESGKVCGLDFTEDMVAKARENARKRGYTNVEFIQGDIEEMPLPDNTYDVVLSNCVLNLVPDKNKAFSEIWRVLKSGGHFCVSDVVIKGRLPQSIRNAAEMYVGCVSGALSMEVYLDLIHKQGFREINVYKQREIPIPGEVLNKYLNGQETEQYKENDYGIFSITVSGYKK
ncbi:MAG: arsenite methyltransferase [Bacteroidales bacterium]|jgi:arsenite methyltransferase|nr:arsenite methyltransferase [Bacteroidales bacterium]MDD4362171.1 arsenite methyltransferase [Bacteroidales bacterium]MDD4430993.1 arsenite methyltransferase [Bacteroidales bacterium]